MGASSIPQVVGPLWLRRWLRAVGAHRPRPNSTVLDEVDRRRWQSFLERAWWRIRRAPAALHPPSRYFPRTLVYRSEPRAALLWGIFAVVFAAALVGLAALVGFGAVHVHVAVIDSIATTVTMPAVAVPLALALLTAVAGCCRGARLGWLAWRPGAVVVADFDQFGTIDDTTPAKVTSLFRDRLALLRVDSAGPSPGAPPQTSFLGVLKSAGVSSGDLLSTLLSVVQASWPTYAFEIHGALQQRDQPPRCGITLHAKRLPNEPVAHIEVWESSWEEAAQQAVDGAVAALLPRTRLCIGPWAYWKRFRLPADLVTAYREAATFEQDRRYDEALRRYDDALALDPTNLTIALQLGQLQEKIGFFVGALTTYQRILALDNPGREPVPRGVYSRHARREWRRAVAAAKYRQIVLLGQEALPREWIGFGGDPEGYREGLREYFWPKLSSLAQRRSDPAGDVISNAINKLIGTEPNPPPMTVEDAQRELIPLAYRATYELQRSLWRWERRPWDLPVSRRTLGLALASLRWRAELAAGLPEDVQWSGLVKELDSAARWAGSSPAPWFGWRPGSVRRWTWQQHYCAACLFAIPLARRHDELLVAALEAEAQGGERPEAEAPSGAEGELARRAVDRLERAAARADNEFVATRGDWVVEEDPELRGLRTFREFDAFVIQYFPGHDRASAQKPTAADRSPAQVGQTEYARGLLGAVATQWHEVWHQRAGQEAIDPHALKRWWSEEREIWTLFGKVARECLNWEGRMRLLSKANELLKHNGIEPVVARYGRNGHDPVEATGPADGSPLVVEWAATPTTVLLSGIERDVLDMLTLPAEEQFEHRIGLLRRVDAESLRLVTRRQHRRMCLLQAAVWGTLSEWLSGDRDDGQLASGEVLRFLEATAVLWARAERQLNIHSQVRTTTERVLVNLTGIRRPPAAG